MAKRKYTSPILNLQPGDDPTIPIGGSQGSSGYDNIYSFSGIDEAIIALIELNCDYFDLQAMDTIDQDGVITLDEFLAWVDANEPDWYSP